MSEEVPFHPVNGRVLIEELPFRPSKTIELITHDVADRTEGIVAALSPCRFGRKKTKGGWEHNGHTFPHDLKVGDRVIYLPKYQDDDIMHLNGKKFRCLDAWEIVGVLDAPPIEGYENPLTGMMEPDKHPLLIH